MAIVMPIKPINSFKRLFSVGVRTRTKSPRIGEGARIRLGARALARGSHLNLYGQQNDYTKDAATGKKDIEREWCDSYGGLMETEIYSFNVEAAIEDAHSVPKYA
jgi:hypothetical protein